MVAKSKITGATNEIETTEIGIFAQ